MSSRIIKALRILVPSLQIKILLFMFIGPRLLLSRRVTALALVGALSLSILSMNSANSEIKDAAKDLNNEGVLALNHNHYQLAIEKLRGALELLPTYRLAKVNLGVAYNNFGLSLRNKPTDAIQYFHKAVFFDTDDDTDSLTSRANLAGIIMWMGKNPDDSETRIALGDSSKSSGDNIGAIVEYCEALKLKNQSVVRDKLLQTLRDFEMGAKPREIACCIDALQRAHNFAATSDSVAGGGSAAVSEKFGNGLPGTSTNDLSASNRVMPSGPAVPLTTYCDAIRQIILTDHIDRITWNDYVMIDAEVDKDGKITNAMVNTRSQGSADEKASALQFIKSLNRVGFLPAGLTGTLKLSFVLCKNVQELSVSVGDIDFGNYVAELQKKIKSNWHPPKENSTLKSVLRFRVYRDGNFEGLKFVHSTSHTEADAAILAAVIAAKPFAPLPDGSPKYVDIGLHFDYSVFNKGDQLTSQNASSASATSHEAGARVNGNAAASTASSDSVASSVSAANTVNFGNGLPTTSIKNSSTSKRVTSSVPAGPLTVYCDAIRQKILTDHMDKIASINYVMIDAEVDKDGKIINAIVNTGSPGSADEKASALQIIKSLNFFGVPPVSLTRTLKLSFVLSKNIQFLSVNVGDIDFGNYMTALERKIKSHWHAPKEDSTLKASVVFRVYRGGNLEGLNFVHSTGKAEADAAVLAAVMAAEPFAPLPDGGREYLDIQFYFDYNVYNDGNQLTSQNASSKSKTSAAGSSSGTVGGVTVASGARGEFDIESEEAVNAITSAQQCFARGMIALEQKDYPLTIQFMESAIVIDPKNALAKKNLSTAYIAYGRTFLRSKPELAMENFRKAKESWPDNPMGSTTIEQAESMFGEGSDSKPKGDAAKL